MSAVLTRSELLAASKSKTAACGLQVKVDGGGLSGQVKSIRAKWFLGASTVTYRMSCRLDDVVHVVYFRESISETSWGLLPPTFTTEWTVVKGWSRSGARTDRSVGGGGTIDYGQMREELKHAVSVAGWQFQLEGGRIPDARATTKAAAYS